MPTTNPILLALSALQQGEDFDELMALRDQQLPTPQAWLDAGWEALSHMKETEEAAQWVSQVMQYAWQAAGPVGKCARASWTNEQARGAQALWQQARAAMKEETT